MDITFLTTAHEENFRKVLKNIKLKAKIENGNLFIRPESLQDYCFAFHSRGLSRCYTCNFLSGYWSNPDTWLEFRFER